MESKNEKKIMPTIYVSVTDINTGRPIPNAVVILDGYRVTTDSVGESVIEASLGSHRIIAEAPNYSPHTDIVEIVGDQQVTVSLVPRMRLL